MSLGTRLLNAVQAFRYTDGSYFYSQQIGSQSATLDGYNNFQACLKNPILLGLIMKIGHYLGQTEFYIGDKDEPQNDKLLELINNPNEYQSKQDFFMEYVFQRIANGWAFIAPIGAEGFEKNIDFIDSLYTLSSGCVEYDTRTVQTKLRSRQEIKDSPIIFHYRSQNIIDRKFTISQVIPFFDVANGLNEDFLLSSPSRIDSVLQPAVNMIKAFEAQNIIIKSNGREMFFSERKGDTLGLQQPISSTDKAEIQRKNRTYGMQHGQDRSMFLKGETGWKSLHIDAKDLGITEVIETCSSAIATAFNVPKDLIATFSSAKYENQKESEIQLIQLVVDSLAADIANSFTSEFKGYDTKPLKYSLDHLAPMEHIEQIKANKAMSLSVAFRNFTQAGLTSEQAQTMFESLGINYLTNEQST